METSLAEGWEPSPVLALNNRVASLSRAIPLSCEPIGESLHGVQFLPTDQKKEILRKKDGFDSFASRRGTLSKRLL